MVALPTERDLGIVLPQASRPAVVYQGGIAEAGKIAEGQGLATLGKDISEGALAIQLGQDKVDYSAAYNDFLTKKMGIDEQFQRDPDYATAPQRYSQAVQDAATQAGAPIINSDMRASFSNATASMRERGINTILHRSYEKSVDADRAFLFDKTQSTIDNAILSPDSATTTALFATNAELIDGMVQKGSISALEGQRLKQEIPQKYAERYYQRLINSDPEAAHRILNGGQLDMGTGHRDASPTTLNGATPERLRPVYDGLIKRGLDPATALGFAANAAQESQGVLTANGDKGASHGLFQWRDDRAAAFKAQYGHLPSQGTMDEQLDFVVKELGGSESRAAEAIRNASPADKAAAVSQFYERPKETENEKRVRTGHAKALASAWGIDPTATASVPPSGAAGPTMGDAPADGTVAPGMPDQPAPVAADGLPRGVQVAGPGAPTDTLPPATQTPAAAGTVPTPPGATAQPGQAAPPTDQAPKKFGDLRDFLRPDQVANLAHQAEVRYRTAENAARIDMERRERAKVAEAKDASEADQSRIIADTFGVGDNKTVTATQIADPTGPYKNLTPAARMQMIGFVERQTKPDPAAVVSHQSAISLVDDIRNGRVTDMTPIYDAYTKGSLSTADFNFVQTQFKSFQTEDGQRLDTTVQKFLTAVKPSIDKSNPLQGQIDMSGGSDFFRLQQDLNAKIAEYRKAGKNPFDLLDPSKPDFFGKPEALWNYQKSIPESLTEYAAKMKAQAVRAAATPAAPKPLPPLPALPPLPKPQ